MARFDDVDVFLAVAEASSFRGAATRLSASRSTVSRAIRRLEDHLGTALFLRDTSSVRLTAAGAAYRGWARKAASALARGERAAMDSVGELGGRVRVTAPLAFGPGFLVPVVHGFLRAHPRVEIDLVLTDALVDPILDEIDVAVRVGPSLADSDLRSRRLGELEMMAVATPERAAQVERGEPVPAVLFAADRARRLEQPLPAPLVPRLTVNDYGALVAAVRLGSGVGVVSLPLVREDLESGRLVRVLPDWKLPHGRIWAVFPARGQLPVALRAFVDALVRVFGSTRQE